MTNLILATAILFSVQGETPPEGKKYVEKWDNGKIKRSYTMVDGKYDGEYLEQYENGKRKVLKFYRRGVITGNVLTGHANGNPSGFVSYLKGKRSGRYWQKYEDGQNREMGSFLDGKLHGTIMKWREDGSPEEKIDYKAGVRHGTYESFFSGTGNPAQKIQYKNGVLDGKAWAFHDLPPDPDKGRYVSAEWEYVQGKMDGDWIAYGENRRKTMLKPYRMGKVTGEIQTWHTSGNLHEKYSVVMGVQQGRYQSWYDDTDTLPESDGEYRKGKQHGKWTTWHENKRPWQMTYFRDGVMHGVFREWYKSGNLSTEGTYANGVAEGKASNYHDDSDTIPEWKRTYKAGKLHGSSVTFHANGRRSVIVEYVHGQRHGTYWSLSYADESVLQAGEYVKDKENGPWFTWKSDNHAVMTMYKMGTATSGPSDTTKPRPAPPKK